MKLALANSVRELTINRLFAFLEEAGEDVGMVNSNTLNFPTVYEGEECGEGCSAVFRLDSGEQVHLGCGNADKLYGPAGRRGVAHFEVRRTWLEYPEQGWSGCSEEMLCAKPPAAPRARRPKR